MQLLHAPATGSNQHLILGLRTADCRLRTGGRGRLLLETAALQGWARSDRIGANPGSDPGALESILREGSSEIFVRSVPLDMTRFELHHRGPIQMGVQLDGDVLNVPG